MPDYRLRYILHKGDQIHAEGAVYTITGDPLGFGGTSVLYPAISDGSKLEIAIKEAFPGGVTRFCRTGGVVRPVDPKDVGALGQLEQYRKQLEKEAELGQTIRNSSVRAIGLWKNLIPSAITVDGKNFTEVSDGIYSILERMDRKGKTFNQLLQYISEPSSEDAPLKTGFLPKVHTTALIIEQALLALQRVHTAGEKGFLFGDIQDGNVFFSDCRLEQGDIGIGNLLDFGCVRPLVDGNQTEEITDRQVFSTMGFIPPEILDPETNNGTLRLTRAADIYSVGCLMLRCVLSSASVRCLGASPVVYDEVIDEEAASRLGCTENIRNLLNHILQKALRPESEDRYPDTDAMLEDIKKLKASTTRYELIAAPSAADYIVPHSRDAEVDRYMDALCAGERVYIWGIGGIGKTQVAIALAQKYEGASYFVRYKKSMRETIRTLKFSGYEFIPKSADMTTRQMREQEYCEKLSFLAQHYRDTLLVIDNFDIDGKDIEKLQNEPAFQDILSLNMKLVFTTRSYYARPEWEVKPLEMQTLLTLMQHYCSNLNYTANDFIPLIKEVEGHTLAIELIAKSLSDSDGELTPENILQALREYNFSGYNFPNVRSDKDREYRQQKIDNHLKALFKLSKLSSNEQYVMQCTALLQETYTSALMFRSCLNSHEKEAFQKLTRRGWLHKTKYNAVTIHPIIKTICIDVLKPTTEKCGKFLQQLSECRKKLILVWGPAGTGRSTVLNALLRKHPEYIFSASTVTTRKKRPSEGDWYQFVSPDEFDTMVENGLLCEYDYCANAAYGTNRVTLEEELSRGIVLVETHPDAFEKFRKNFPESLIIGILPPSAEELERRWRAAGLEDWQVLENIKKEAEAPYNVRKEWLAKYSYLVRNNNIEDCAAEISNIIQKCMTGE